MIENKLNEEKFLNNIYKTYKVSNEYGVCNVINSLLNNGIAVKSVSINEDADIGCKVYQGEYTLDSFINDVYYGLPNDIDCNFGIELQDERAERIMFYPESNILISICNDKNFEVSDILGYTRHLNI